MRNSFSRSCLPNWRAASRPALALVTGALVVLLAVGCGGGGSDASAGPALPGALDASFGKANDGTPDGVVNLSLGNGNDAANAMAVQADGKIVVAGSSTSTGGATHNIVVQRFNTDGTLDTGFGKSSDGSPDGVVSLNLGDNTDDVARAVAIQADGKIVVVGTSVGQSSNIVLARLNADGTLDAVFGSGMADGTPDGVVAVNLGVGDDVANAMVIQPNGKIVVAGTTTSTTGGTTSKNIMVARLNTDGTPDVGFGVGTADGTPDGVVSISLGDGSDEANAVALQADGRIVVAGTTTTTSTGATSNIAVVRLNGNGTLDADFGAGNADGTPDGVVSVSLGDGADVAKSVAIQSNGKILVAGTTVAADKSINIAVARLNADGTLDASFGAGTADGTPDGVVAVSLGKGDDDVNAMTVQADGKIIVVGSTTSTGSSANIAVARLNANGSLDASFGAGNADGTPDGVVSLSLGDGSEFARAVALQADGKIVVAGDHVSGSSTDIFVLRLIGG